MLTFISNGRPGHVTISSREEITLVESPGKLSNDREECTRTPVNSNDGADQSPGVPFLLSGGLEAGIVKLTTPSGGLLGCISGPSQLGGGLRWRHQWTFPTGWRHQWTFPSRWWTGWRHQWTFTTGWRTRWRHQWTFPTGWRHQWTFPSGWWTGWRH